MKLRKRRTPIQVCYHIAVCKRKLGTFKKLSVSKKCYAELFLRTIKRIKNEASKNI